MLVAHAAACVCPAKLLPKADADSFKLLLVQTLLWHALGARCYNRCWIPYEATAAHS